MGRFSPMNLTLYQFATGRCITSSEFITTLDQSLFSIEQSMFHFDPGWKKRKKSKKTKTKQQQQKVNNYSRGQCTGILLNPIDGRHHRALFKQFFPVCSRFIHFLRRCQTETNFVFQFCFFSAHSIGRLSRRALLRSSFSLAITSIVGTLIFN